MKPSKPRTCPFCGGKNVRIAFDAWTRDGKPKPPFHVYCETCRSGGPEMPTERRAWNAWEKRSSEDALRKAVLGLLPIARVYAGKFPGREILSGYPDDGGRIVVPRTEIDNAERVVGLREDPAK